MITSFKDLKSNAGAIKSPKKGFTLIELLVVIAIIALLLSIMMPSLSMVKRKAQSIVCRSNVRQLAIAWWLYAGDNQEGIVGGSTGNNPVVGDSWTYCWVKPPQEEDGTLVPPSGTSDPDAVTLENELRGIERGYLYPYTDNTDLYHCPGSNAEIVGDGGYRSFSITGLMNGELAPPTGYPEHAVKKITDVVRPGTKMVFLENSDARGWNIGSWIFPDMIGDRWGDPLAIWHGKGSVLGFADGHAELHKWKSNSTLAVAAEDYRWGTINPGSTPGYDGNTEDIEFMFKAYQPKK